MEWPWNLWNLFINSSQNSSIIAGDKVRCMILTWEHEFCCRKVTSTASGAKFIVHSRTAHPTEFGMILNSLRQSR